MLASKPASRPKRHGPPRALVLYSTQSAQTPMDLARQQTEVLRQSGLKRVFELDPVMLGPEGLSLEAAGELLASRRYAWVFAVDRDCLNPDPAAYLALVSLFQRHQTCLHFLATGETLWLGPFTALQEGLRMMARLGAVASASDAVIPASGGR